MVLSWLVCLALVAVQEGSASPIASGLVRSLDLEPPPGTWVQHFRLERAGARADEAPLGLLRYVAGPDAEGGERVEVELQYLVDGMTLIHIEQASPERRRVVFREVRARGGRTLFLEGHSGVGWSGYELGGPEVVRHELAGGELPLFLIEAVRRGSALPEEMAVLDPLAATDELLKLATRSNGEERVFEARRADGSLRWRVSARGAELVEWRFQERGPAARAIPSEEYRELREQHELAMSAVREAAAAKMRDPATLLR